MRVTWAKWLHAVRSTVAPPETVTVESPHGQVPVRLAELTDADEPEPGTTVRGRTGSGHEVVYTKEAAGPGEPMGQHLPAVLKLVLAESRAAQDAQANRAIPLADSYAKHFASMLATVERQASEIAELKQQLAKAQGDTGMSQVLAETERGKQKMRADAMQLVREVLAGVKGHVDVRKKLTLLVNMLKPETVDMFVRDVGPEFIAELLGGEEAMRLPEAKKTTTPQEAAAATLEPAAATQEPASAA